jgi:hypothetical protein
MRHVHARRTVLALAAAFVLLAALFAWLRGSTGF